MIYGEDASDADMTSIGVGLGDGGDDKERGGKFKTRSF